MWAKQVGKCIRSLGQTMDRVGVALEASLTYTEHRTLNEGRARTSVH